MENRREQLVSDAPAIKTEPADLTLRGRAQSLVRDSILDGHFRPGQKLVERELSELTGVSRSILRECLSHLEAKGLIERQSYRGFRVALLSRKNIEEIYELRLPVEALAAELFTERASEDHTVALRSAQTALEASMSSFDVGWIRNAKERYYDILFSGCGNAEMGRALENVIDRIYYLRGQTMQDPDRRRASLAEMRRLTDALTNRDRHEARDASLSHIKAARDAMLKRLATIHNRYAAKTPAEAP
ncbi:MAG: GntR family transcriptional regulator [Pontixanthobacter sp.]